MTLTMTLMQGAQLTITTEIFTERDVEGNIGHCIACIVAKQFIVCWLIDWLIDETWRLAVIVYHVLCLNSMSYQKTVWTVK